MDESHFEGKADRRIKSDRRGEIQNKAYKGMERRFVDRRARVIREAPPPAATLSSKAGRFRSLVLEGNGPFSIGRGQENALVLDDPACSGRVPPDQRGSPPTSGGPVVRPSDHARLPSHSRLWYGDT